MAKFYSCAIEKRPGTVAADEKLKISAFRQKTPPPRLHENTAENLWVIKNTLRTNATISGNEENFYFGGNQTARTQRDFSVKQ